MHHQTQTSNNIHLAAKSEFSLTVLGLDFSEPSTGRVACDRSCLVGLPVGKMADRLVMYYDVESSFSYLAFEILQRCCTLIMADRSSLLSSVASELIASSSPVPTLRTVLRCVARRWARFRRQGRAMH